MPRSWRHYQYGLAFLGRLHLRGTLQAAQGSRMAQAGEDDFGAWQRDVVRMTGTGAD